MDLATENIFQRMSAMTYSSRLLYNVLLSRRDTDIPNVSGHKRNLFVTVNVPDSVTQDPAGTLFPRGEIHINA